MTERHTLPMRRYCETFELPYGGLTNGHIVNVGRYPDGAVAEVFISGGRSGETVQAMARDSGVILSLALQYGVPLSAIRHAITRDSQNLPQSIIGAVVDRLVEASS